SLPRGPHTRAGGGDHSRHLAGHACAQPPRGVCLRGPAWHLRAGPAAGGGARAGPGRAGLLMSTAEPRVPAGGGGAGHLGQYHILVFAELWEVDLVGVVDIDGERAASIARKYDTLAFTDHRDLIGRVDVASVAVPTDQHYAVTRDLLEAGVSVLVEKPMAPT